MPAEIILTPACAALLTQPLDAVIRNLREKCPAAPLHLLISDLDEICDQLAEIDPTGALTKATHTVLRDLDDGACVPGEHLAALRNHYGPDEEDRPVGDDTALLAWERDLAHAGINAERHWRADMVRMLDTVLRAMVAETLQVAA